jgi:hypothetical protein
MGRSRSARPESLSSRAVHFKDKSGPCTAATVKGGKTLKVVCQAKHGPIDYTLDEASQGAVGVRFRSGTREYCTVFGGAGTKDVAHKKYAAHDAPAPAMCPVPPKPCP